MFRLCLSSRWIRLVVLGAVLCASASMGCGGKKPTVSGTVSYKGEKLGNGNVTFIGADNKAAVSPINADGTYRVNDAPVGAVKITVETAPIPEQSSSPMMKGVDMPDMKGKSSNVGKYVKIPARYKDPAQSGLTYQVKSGAQKHDIKLDD